MPTLAPDLTNLEKRQSVSTSLLTYGCWSGTLDRIGTNVAMAVIRRRVRDLPISVRQLNDSPPYFGYNENGVYVYACESSGTDGMYYYFDKKRLDWISHRMD